jgi:Anti-sigma regulatory factor (Ser/Thr protein kinase)
VSEEPAENALVTLTIPCAPEYVGTARLTILGVAGRMGFSYDQIEDIRLAVGEACTNAIERANRNGSNGGGASAQIDMRCLVEAKRLTIEIEDNVRGGASGTEGGEAAEEEFSAQELGAVLMEILVDEVTLEAAPNGGTRARLVKYLSDTAPSE